MPGRLLVSFLDSSGESYTSTRARNTISKATVALMKAQEIEGAIFHTLRHTAGSWAGQAGSPGVLIARFLGHATVTITERYIHLNPEHFKSIVSALDTAEGSAVVTQTATQDSEAVEAVEAKVVN